MQHLGSALLPWLASAALAVALLAGLLTLVVRADDPASPLVIYSAAERPVPLPLDPDGPTRVDLNRATFEELDALPEIGERRAQRVLDARAERPFRSLDDVIRREVLPARVVEAIAERIEVRP